MEPSQQPPAQQSPAWHSLDYDPPPQARQRSPRQESQWHTSPPTMADIGHEFRRAGRGLRSMGSDIWTLSIKDFGREIQRLRAFLQHPPRWFWVALIVGGALWDIFWAISLRNYFLFHHH
jgi:hypothetical protein